MFLRPGIVPGLSWVDETSAFVQRTADRPCAAVFAIEISGVVAWLSRALAPLPRSEQGLILGRSFYEELGGHRADARDTEIDLLRRIGRSRLATLRTTVSYPIFDSVN